MRHIPRAKLENVNHEVIRHIALDEAFQMIAAGDAMRVSKINAKSLTIRLSAGRKPDRVKNETSITFAEMQAIAGLRGCRRRARRRGYVGNFVDRALTKLELWPRIGDTKAVRVGPRF